MPTDIDRIASEAADRIEATDVNKLPWRDAGPLRDIAEANEGIEAAKDRLRVAVETARAKGISWTAIGAVLGVSRQAARERFSARSSAA